MATSITPAFRIGTKELYLPMANITFLRGRDPHHAKFQVPLWFSKLDLRDYLWHAYNVETYSARSYVKLSPVRPKEGHHPRRWHRKRSRKFMTVELARPFVWPAEPEDLSEWSADTVQGASKEQRSFQELQGSTKDTIVNEERRERMREQARALLEGKAKWKPPVRSFGTEMYSRQR
ncbi:hypothetical protein M409DRAFT_67643 [Zasmidium cellare ATCC 36951]|uniref:Large ribosomal subunit protein uL23m n=1 Tax=Zasmidium cellare ATCC 36951 TaxID=1080233 RepID=A0A6A6CFC1_ZASCE|nr:uncharacterized protein M409DRAFT_67643 [Zasmidium cellare ATCC 36951]KAF2164950.1 hypothetical protein M409DRAFT_67643 [Zasmidium cellare ATCC 36951]